MDECPSEDATLIREAQAKSTGATVHAVNGLLGNYRNQIRNYHYWAFEAKKSDQQAKEASRLKASAEEYARKLRIFAATGKLEK